MDVQAAKIALAKLILDLDDPSLILRMKELLSEELEGQDQSISSQERKEIQLGLSQLDRGEQISFDDFLDRVS